MFFRLASGMRDEMAAPLAESKWGQGDNPSLDSPATDCGKKVSHSLPEALGLSQGALLRSLDLSVFHPRSFSRQGNLNRSRA